jgi:hypothetical protein
MIYGAIAGAIVGLLVGLGFKLFGKGKPCPQCQVPLPIPWFSAPRQCPKCGCKLNKKGEKVQEDE